MHKVIGYTIIIGIFIALFITFFFVFWKVVDFSWWQALLVMSGIYAATAIIIALVYLAVSLIV